MLEENSFVKDVLKISGVEGILVTSRSGKVISKVGLNFDQATSEKLTEKIIYIVLIYLQANIAIKEIEIKWHNYNLLIMIKNGLILVTYCSQDQIMPLLRITLNVVLAHLLEDKKFIKQIKKYLEEKPPVLKPDQLEPGEIKIISKLQ
jgi:hypothetical protein